MLAYLIFISFLFFLLGSFVLYVLFIYPFMLFLSLFLTVNSLYVIIPLIVFVFFSYVTLASKVSSSSTTIATWRCYCVYAILNDHRDVPDVSNNSTVFWHKTQHKTSTLWSTKLYRIERKSKTNVSKEWCALFKRSKYK